MAFDVSKAALPALWKSDPGFVALAKHLYGDDVTLETVAKDLFGKMEPAQSDVSAGEQPKTRKKKTLDDRGLQVVGKAFIDLVEKAYDAGLIDDEGNLNEEEISKSREYVRDHGGRFASQGKHTGKMVAGIAAAGALAGTGAILGSKAPKAAKYAGESIKFVGDHLKSADPVERHVARSLLPHALKATGKAVGTAGLSATATAGGVYEGTRTYQEMRDHAIKKGMPLRAGAAYVNNAARVAEKVKPYDAKHIGRATKIRRLREAAHDKSAAVVYTPTKPLQGIADILKRAEVSKDWAEYDRRRRGDKTWQKHQIKADIGGAGAGVGLIGTGTVFGSAGEHMVRAQGLAAGQREQYEHAAGKGERALDMKHRGVSGAEDVMEQAMEHHSLGQEMGHDARAAFRGARRRGRVGAALGAATVGATGYTAWEQHKANARARELTRNAREEAKKSHDVTWEGDFSKVDEDKRQVFGWASVAELDGKPVVDLQGDYIHPDDVEKAAYDYVLKSRVGGDMHSRVDEYGNVIEKADRPLHVSDLIESVVFTPEKCEAMGISKNLSGRWWTGFQINDPDVWSDVKSGRRTGFSIHGAGMRKNIDIDELDPEAELIGKAYQESGDMNEFIDNLCTLEEVTGSESFGDLAKHLAHGLEVPQVNAQQARNAGVFGSMGSGVGGLAGGAIGAKMGHVGEGAAIGATVGGLTGTAAGMHHGREKPQRPPAVHAAMGSVGKAVDNTNRMGGGPGARQGFYQQYALQQATEMLAPQVAQHIQTMQEQRWQQQMMEQQMLAQQAQQAPQNFSVQMGPYANHSQGGQSQTSNPLTPSQQAPTTGPTMPNTPSTPQSMGAS